MKNRKNLVFPPPNITGVLHIGHGMQQVLMDIICKYYKIHKNKTINWIPGQDHAGLGAYIVAKNMPGNTEQNLLELKEKNRKIIRHQMQSLGLNAQWTKELFTLDPNYKEAVRKVFKQLYLKDLIYKELQLTYWDTEAKTALADCEIKHIETKTKICYIKYRSLEDPSLFIEVATTRPETIYADQAIAVHPEDKRYKNFIGKEYLVPIVCRTIKVIADNSIDREFGTGAVKITPAHSFVDGKIAKIHGLTFKSIISKQGLFTCHPVVGLNCEEAREKTLTLLKQEDSLIKIKEHISSIPKGERTGKTIEIIPTQQWFLRSSKMIDTVKKKAEEICFYPSSYKKYS